MPEDTEVTGATATIEAVTDEPSGEPIEPGSTTQDSNDLAKLLAQVEEYNQKLTAEAAARAAAEAKIAEERAAREKAEQERDKEIKVRIGIQANSTQKLQRLAVLEQQLATSAANADLSKEMSQTRKLVEKLALNQLSPEELQEFNDNIKREEERQELERYRKQAQTSQAPATQEPPVLTPEWKERLHRDYFSDFDVDPLDLTDEEWHQTDSRDQFHWYNQVRAEFEKRHNAKLQKTPASNPDVERIKAELEAEYEARRQEDAKKLAEAQAAAEAVRKEAEEAKRLAEEQLNRSRGMDRGHTSLPEPSIEGTTAQKALAKLPPSSWQYGTPEERAAYRRGMDTNSKSVRDALVADARAKSRNS